MSFFKRITGLFSSSAPEGGLGLGGEDVHEGTGRGGGEDEREDGDEDTQMNDRPDGDADEDAEILNGFEDEKPQPIPEPTTVSKSARKKKKKDKKGKRRSSGVEEEDVNIAISTPLEMGEEVQSTSFDPEPEPNTNSKSRRRKRREKKSLQAEEDVLPDANEEVSVPENMDLDTSEPSNGKKKPRSKRSDVSQSAEFDDSRDIPAEEEEIELHTQAPSSSPSKSKKRKPDKGRRDSFPVVVIEGSNSAVLFPRADEAEGGMFAEKRMRRDSAEKERKRKRSVESDREVLGAEDTSDVDLEVEMQGRKKKKKKKRKVVEGEVEVEGEDVAAQDAMGEVEEELLPVEKEKRSHKEKEKIVESVSAPTGANGEDINVEPPPVEKKKRSHKKKVRKPVDAIHETLPEENLSAQETHMLVVDGDQVENEVALSAKSSEDEGNSREFKEDPDAMASMLNTAIRRGKAPKVASTAKKSTLKPILPSVKAQPAILPPVPAWKTTQLTTTPGRSSPKPSSTPALPPSKLVDLREASNSPAPILPPSRMTTPTLTRRASQTILPPSRLSTPKVTVVKSQVVRPPTMSRQSTPVISSANSKDILPTSRPVTPAIASGKLQTNIPPPSTSILPPPKPTFATPASSKAKSFIRTSTPILPPSHSKTPLAIEKPSVSIETPSKPQADVFSVLTPQVVIKPRPRASLLSVAPIASPNPKDSAILPAHQAILPKSGGKTREGLDIPIEDDEPSNPSFRKPLSPAILPVLQETHVQQDENMEISPDDRGNDENKEPKQPSLKALGKRKAVDEPKAKTAKKARQQRKERSSSDIRQFGVMGSQQVRSLLASVESSSSINGEAKGVIVDEPLSETHTLSLPAWQTVEVEPHKALASDSTTAAAPMLLASSSHVSSSTPLLPPVVRASLGFQRRSTPQFTPINKSVNPKSLYSPAVVLPSASTSSQHPPQQSAPIASEHNPIQGGRSTSPQQNSVDEGAQSVNGYTLWPMEDDEQQQDDTSIAEAEEDESQVRLQVYSKIPLGSNVRRKRRLPVGDPESPPPRSGTKPPSSSKKSSTPKANAPRVRETRVRGLADEDAITIKEAVQNYGLQHDMNQQELNAYVQLTGDSDSKKFWEEIYGQVPHVSMAKVQNYCRRAFHNFIRGSWSQEQDEELRDAYERFPKEWKQISGIINRSAEDARVRWRDYGSVGASMKKDSWDLEEEERLREVYAEYLEVIQVELKKSKNVKDKNGKRAKTKDAEAMIDWTVVSQKMGGTRSRLQCLQKWNNLKAREEEGRVHLNPIGVEWRVRDGSNQSQDLRPDQKLRLLRAIRDSGAGQVESIPWRSLVRELDMKGWRMAMKICLRNLMINVPDHKNMLLQDVVSSLIYSFEASSPYDPPGFIKVDKTVQHALDRKTREKKASKYYDKEYASLHGEGDNGEGSSRKKFIKKFKSSKRITPSQSENDEEEDFPSTDRTKIRERMKRVDEDHSQDPPLLQDDDEDLSGELRTAWASVTPKAKAKQPIFTPKISQRQRKSRPRDSSDEEEESVLVARKDSSEDENTMQVDEEPPVSNHVHESDERELSGSDEEMSNVNDETMLRNGLIDDEAEESLNDSSPGSGDDEGIPVVSSPSAVKSEEIDADDSIAIYSEDEDQVTNLAGTENSISPSDLESEADDRSSSDEVSQYENDFIEDVNAVTRSHPSSDSQSDNEEESVANDLASQSDDQQNEVRSNPQSPAQQTSIHSYTSPTIKVNTYSPVAINLNHIPVSQGGQDDDSAVEDDSDDVNEHTITMNGWSQLPNMVEEDSSDEVASDADEEALEFGRNAIQDEGAESSDDEDEVLESEQNMIQYKSVESSDEQEEILESDQHHMQKDRARSSAYEQEIPESEPYFPNMKEEPQLPVNTTNGYSLGSAWERTRKVLERDSGDDEISVSSDDTTSAIFAVAVPKVARALSEEL